MIVKIRNKKIDLSTLEIKYYRQILFGISDDYFNEDYINVGNRDIELIKLQYKWVLMYPSEIPFFKRRRVVNYILQRFYLEFFEYKDYGEETCNRIYKTIKGDK